MAYSIEQLNTWLDEAMQAKHDLLTGQAVKRVSGPSSLMEFQATDPDSMNKLDAWISTLQTWIDNGSSRPSTIRPIRFGF